MSAEAVTCPNCSAPLHLEPNQTLVICLYCNSSVRISSLAAASSAAGEPAAPAPARAVVEHTLSPGDAEQIRQLIAAARQPEAVQRYHAITQASQPEAEQAIRTLAQDISTELLTASPLNPLGMAMAVGSVVLVLGGGVAILAAFILFVLPLMLDIRSGTAGLSLMLSIFLGIGGALGLAVGGVVLWLSWKGLLATIKYLPGRIAPARVLKYALIGQTPVQTGIVDLFRVWVEVQPQGERPFRAQVTLAVMKDHLSRLHPDTVMQVKYLPGQPDPPILIKPLPH
jgi:hypothetical protein